VGKLQWTYIVVLVVLLAGIAWFIYKKYFDGSAPTLIERPRIFQDVAKIKTIHQPELNAYSLYLIVKCDTTAKCQFEAARRMQKKNMASTVSIVVLSLYAMLFSLMPTFDKIQKIQDNKDILAMMSIFMSASIIAFSLYEMLKRYDLRSVLFLKSARRLSELRDRALEVHLRVSQELSDYVEIENAYHKILNDNDDNHAKLDYDTVRVQLRELVGHKAAEATLLRLANIWLVPILAVLAPLIIGLLYLGVTAVISTIPSAPITPTEQTLRFDAGTSLYFSANQ
jgi:hypothetical protein